MEKKHKNKLKYIRSSYLAHKHLRNYSAIVYMLFVVISIQGMVLVRLLMYDNASYKYKDKGKTKGLKDS